MTATSTSNKSYRRDLLLYAIAVVVLIALDQWTKALVIRDLSDGRVVTVIPRILQFRYLTNTGAAFSVMTGKTWFLIVLTVLILLIAVFLLAFQKVPGKWDQIALVLMIAGGAGNLIDRVSRHYVVDFIEVTFTNFAVFNFADCCVTIGALILILSAVLSFAREEDTDETEGNEE